MRCHMIRKLSLLVPLFCVNLIQAGQPDDVKPTSVLTVWDKVESSKVALTPAALTGKNDWIVAVKMDKRGHSFEGDAVVDNGRIVLVLRRQDATLEVHALKPDGVVSRLRLRLQTDAGDLAVRLERMTLAENSKNGVCLEAVFKTAKGAEVAAKFRIKRGEVAVQVEPGTGAGKLRVEAPGALWCCPISSPTTSLSTPSRCRSSRSSCPARASCCTRRPRATLLPAASSRLGSRT